MPQRLSSTLTEFHYPTSASQLHTIDMLWACSVLRNNPERVVLLPSGPAQFAFRWVLLLGSSVESPRMAGSAKHTRAHSLVPGQSHARLFGEITGKHISMVCCCNKQYNYYKCCRAKHINIRHCNDMGLHMLAIAIPAEVFTSAGYAAAVGTIPVGRMLPQSASSSRRWP